jgi:recombination protein RecA
MVDSIAALSTKAELEEEKLNRGRQSQIRGMMMDYALKKVAGLIPSRKAILFCVNQLRDRTDVQYGETKKPPGGNAMKFYASVRIRIKLLGKWKRTKGGKSYIAGFKLLLISEKNRLNDPYKQMEIWLDFKRGLYPAGGQRKKKG